MASHGLSLNNIQVHESDQIIGMVQSKTSATSANSTCLLSRAVGFS